MTDREEKTSNVPVQRECRIPGKRAWLIWKSLFEIDEKYEPIKVCHSKNESSLLDYRLMQRISLRAFLDRCCSAQA